MSLSYTCDVHCDRCGDWIHGVTAGVPLQLSTRALKKAKQSGWSRYTKSIYTDLCPKCLEESRRNPE